MNLEWLKGFVKNIDFQNKYFEFLINITFLDFITQDILPKHKAVAGQSVYGVFICNCHVQWNCVGR